MKSLTIPKIKSRILFFLLNFFAGYLLVSSVQASEVTVSATIPDIVPPSVPILISPADGALTSDNTPTSRWYESTDNLAVSHYVFYLNGSILFNNVPLVATENSQYKLEYDSLNGIYSLTVKNSLTDKTHTWKVVAVDYAGNSASSDTWDFTIDTLVPSFILTKIGDTGVNISASNPSSVPSSPILIFQNDATANEPILLATGEANSSVKLTVTIPGDPTQSFTKTINGSGQYELQLGILPRDTNIRLDFIITDQVGHVSVLEGVYFRIALQYYPTSSPTPTASVTIGPGATISPTLTVSPGDDGKPRPTASVSATLTPIPIISPPASPTGLIPIIPPREIIHEAVDETLELLPQSTADKIRDFLTSTLWKNLSVWFAWALLLLFYLLAYLLLLSKFLNDLSGLILGRVAALLLPQMTQAWQNLVFEHRTTSAGPLVKVELLNEQKERLDVAITDINGNFNDFTWPSDQKWSLQADDANFYFPVGGERPKQLQFEQFYQGQLFNRENYAGKPILIPTLRAAGQEQLLFLERLRIFVLYLLSYPWWFWLLMTLVALVFVLRYPGWLNYATLGFYGLIGLHKLWQRLQSKQTLTMRVELKGGDRKFSDNLVVALFDNESGRKKSMVLAFDFAKAKAFEHELTNARVCAFAKDLALESDEQEAEGKVVFIGQKSGDLTLKMTKI